MNKEQLEDILGSRLHTCSLIIKQVEDKWIVTTSHTIPIEDYKAITKSLKHYGGDRVSAGKDSHWWVPAGEEEQTQNAFQGVDLDASTKRAVLNELENLKQADMDSQDARDKMVQHIKNIEGMLQ